MSETNDDRVTKIDAQMYAQQVTESIREHRLRYLWLFIAVYLAIVLGGVSLYQLFWLDVRGTVDRLRGVPSSQR